MSAPAAADGKQPWLGLAPYQEEDRERFFGRDRATQDLLRLVRREVLTVLFGRSGSGKSSLLLAGLFPQLRAERFLPVWLRLDHSGKIAYSGQIRAAIAQAVAAHGIEVEIRNEPLAGEADDFWEYLHRAVLWDSRNQPVTPLLVFDQFEEIFTLGKDQPRIAGFLEQLGDVVENRIPASVRERVENAAAKLPAAYAERHYKVIVSLREDFVSRLDGLSRDMPSIMHNRYGLEPMTGCQALEAVRKPGGELVSEQGALAIVRFVAAANEAGERCGDADLPRLIVEPALLSLVCSELNLLRIKERRETIDVDRIADSGDQIIENFYERCVQGLSASDRAFIEDRLVTASGFRTAVPVEEALAADLSREEIARLIDSRLLRSEDRLGIPHIELTHDVLTKVVVRSRHFRRQREEMESSRRAEIAAAESREREAREAMREKKNRRVRRDRWIAVCAAVLFAVLAGLAVKASWEAIDQKKAAVAFSVKAGVLRVKAESASAMAKAETKSAKARLWAIHAIGVSHRDAELGLLLSIEAAMVAFNDSNSDTNDAPIEIEQSLRTATRQSLIRKRYAGHSAPIYSVAYDSAGARLVTGAEFGDSTARVWDVKSGSEIARLDHGKMPGPDGGNTTVSCARFSPDGRRIVTSTYRDGGFVYIWDAGDLGDGKSGPKVISQPLGIFRGHNAWVTCVAFSPDGRLVASGGFDNVVRIWDLETRKEIMPPLAGHSARIRSVVFGKSGREILTSSDDGTAALWDIGPALDAPGAAVTRRVFDCFAGLRDNRRETLHNAALSPDGSWIATAGNDHYLRVWNARSGVQLAAASHPDGVMVVDFIGDNQLVSACNDATLRFWELTPAIEDAIVRGPVPPAQPRFLRLVASQRGHRGWIRAVAVSPDKRSIASGGNDGDARLWALPQGGEIAVLGGYGRGNFLCAALGGGEDKPLVYGAARDGSIRIIDAWSGEPSGLQPRFDSPEIHHDGEIRAIAVSPDGFRLVTAGADQTAIVWNLATGQPVFRWTGHQGENGGTIYHARFSADGKWIVTASDDGSAQVWSAADGSPAAALIPGNADFTAGEISQPAELAARLAARAGPPAAFVWDRLTAAEQAALQAPPADLKLLRSTIRSALNRLVAGPPLAGESAFSAVRSGPQTRSSASAVSNRFLLLGAFPKLLHAQNRGIYDARFSPDGARIVTADFNAQTATIWDAATGRPLRVLPAAKKPDEGHADAVVSAAFSPDGRHVITACTDGYCRIWSADTAAQPELIPHNVAVRDACYSPDGGLILTAAVDGIARLWDPRSLKLRSELPGHTDTIPDASFSAGGSYIATTSRDGTIRICYSKPWDLYSLANQRITRKLTDKERALYEVSSPQDPAGDREDKPPRAK